MLRGLRNTLSVLLILALLASNVLSLTWEAFQIAASGLLSAASIPTVHQQKVTAERRKKQLVRKTGNNIRKRTLRSAAINVGSMAGEAIPYVGIAVIVGATGYELKLACDNLLDLESLYDDFSIEREPERGMVEKICDPQLSAGASDITEWARDMLEYGDEPESTVEASTAPQKST